MKQTVQVDIGLDLKPADISPSIILLGGIGTTQQYDGSSGQYLPDFSSTPAVLQPVVWLNDPNGLFSSGYAVPTSVVWTEIVGGVRTAITTGAAYNITASEDTDEIIVGGSTAQVPVMGRLQLKKNIVPGKPLTLEVEFDVADPNTGALRHFVLTEQFLCEVIAEQPVIKLDASEHQFYNPTADSNDFTVNAEFLLGGSAVDPTKGELVWCKRRANGGYTEVGTELEDFDVDVSADKMSITVHRSLIGHRIDLRVYGKYDDNGNPSSIAISDSLPKADLVFVRKIPKWTASVIKGHRSLSAGIKYIYPEAQIIVGKTLLTNPENWFDIGWRTSTCNAQGNLSYAQVATGAKPNIPTAKVAKKFGGKVEMVVEERDPPAALVDDDGNYLVDDDGAILITHLD